MKHYLAACSFLTFMIVGCCTEQPMNKKSPDKNTATTQQPAKDSDATSSSAPNTNAGSAQSSTSPDDQKALDLGSQGVGGEGGEGE